MVKVGLKLWNINTDFYFEEACKLYKQKIFDYIELYIVPSHLELLNKWKTLSIPFDIHAPHFAHKMNLSKPEYRESNLLLYKEVQEYADELNASVIVFHGGSGGNYKETAKQLLSFSDKRSLIENKPYETLPFVNEAFYVGSKFEEIEYIINNTNCGFCLDIGHAVCAANSFGINPYLYIEKFLSLSPKRIHLSDTDIDTTLDKHFNLGDGNLDIKRILSMLPKNINITIETNKKSKTNLDDFVRDVAILKEILK